MTILQFIIVALAMQGTSAMSTFQFTRDKRSTRSIVLRVNVPTIHQCAEVCLSLNLCTSLNFDKKNKRCHIASRTWMISPLKEDNDFLYAETDNIFQVSRVIVNYIE